jgi:hypothetical protein
MNLHKNSIRDYVNKYRAISINIFFALLFIIYIIKN